MARRNRAATADAGADDPGTSGALALDPAAEPAGDSGPLTGPHDGDDLDPEVTDAVGTVDFGAVRVPVPARGNVTVEPTANGRMQAVHIALPEGRLSVSALAAPKSSKLWPDLAREIDASLRDGGARVRSFPGHWGRELHATSGGATSVFVGVDGPRWMLYGVATGPTTHAESLDAELRRMLRGTVVVRGRSPYPVRTVLPLVVPEHLAEAVATAAAEQKAAEQKAAEQKAAEQKTAKKGTGKKSAAAKKAAGKKAAEKKAANQAAGTNGAEQALPVAEREPAAAPQATEPAAAQAAGPVGAEQPAAAQQAQPEPVAAQPASIPPAAAPPDEELLPTTPLLQSPAERRAAAAAWRSRPGSTIGSASAPPQWTDAAAASDPRPTWFGAGVEVDEPTEILSPLGAEPAEQIEPAPAVPAGSGTTGSVPAQVPAEVSAEVSEDMATDMATDVSADVWADEPVVTDVPTQPWHSDVESGTGGRRRLREPDVAGTGGWLPAAVAGVDGPLSGTGGRRRLREPDVAGTGGWLPAAVAGVDRPLSGTGGRRRLREPDVAETRGGLPVVGPGATEVESPLAGTGGRRLREQDVAETGGWLPVIAGLDAPLVSTGGRRRLREPEPLAPSDRDAVPTEPWSLTPPVAAAAPTTRALPVQTEVRRTSSGHVNGLSADRALASEGWRRELEADSAAGHGRRRTRRTLGAEYLIDTGEQEIWTGGGSRHPLAPEPVTEPFVALAVPAAPAAATPPRHGRHSSPEPGQSAVTETVQLRALLRELGAPRSLDDRPSGRHRRPN